MQGDEYFCPSFSCYSSDRVSEIAAKISDEVKRDSQMTEEDVDGEEDFEFSLVCENSESLERELLFNRQIHPFLPVFNRDLLPHSGSYDVDHNAESSGNANSPVQVSLKDLFLEEREPASSSSSEVDELESAAPGTYCVWKPKTTTTEPSPSRCNKSNSTGSTFKRWSIRDLMRRSNSDGNDNFIFLTPRKGTKNEASKAKDSAEASKAAVKSKAKSNSNVTKEKASTSAAVSLRNHTTKEVDKNKRRSYLPYRQTLFTPPFF